MSNVICLNKDQVLPDTTQDKLIPITYNISNEGLEAVVIEHVYPACGCTKVNFKPTILQPGENLDVVLVFNTSRRTGQQFKSAVVEGSFLPPIRLTFKVNIIS